MWSMVRLAVAEGKPGADRALDDLCRLYEKPIFIYILRAGHSPETAQDLKQAFFEQLLAKNALADAEATRVKLRAFLLTRLQSFLVDQYRRGSAQKRGGGQVVVMNGQVIGLVDLPIAGLMSNEHADIVAKKAGTVLDGFKMCGSELNNPNMQLSLLGLVVIPELRISDKGLVDVTNFDFISVLDD